MAVLWRLTVRASAAQCILEAGGVQRIVSAMKKHASNVAVQQYGGLAFNRILCKGAVSVPAEGGGSVNAERANGELSGDAGEYSDSELECVPGSPRCCPVTNSNGEEQQTDDERAAGEDGVVGPNTAGHTAAVRDVLWLDSVLFFGGNDGELNVWTSDVRSKPASQSRQKGEEQCSIDHPAFIG